MKRISNKNKKPTQKLLKLNHENYYSPFNTAISNSKVSDYLLSPEYYFKKNILTEEEYQKSKSKSFKLLYGGITKEYRNMPFFEKVYEYTETLWKSWQENGYIETPVFGRKLKACFYQNMYPSKLLNYLLQVFETERNLTVLLKIHNQISSATVNLVLYTYDSLLLDYSLDNQSVTINSLLDILEDKGRYPVKLEIGKNYQEMIEKKVSRKKLT